MQNKKKSKQRFLEYSVFLVVIGILIAIAIPSFHRARLFAVAGSTLGGLRMLDAAIDQYALQHKKSPGDPVRIEDVAMYITNSGNRAMLTRDGGVYIKGINTPLGDEFSISAVGAPPKVPYPTWKKIASVTNTNFFGSFPIETEGEYKARMAKTEKQ